MKIGTVSKWMVPIVEVGFRQWSEHWQSLNVLLDTGYHREFRINRNVRDQLGLPLVFTAASGPFTKAELLLGGISKRVNEVEMFEGIYFDGALGTALLHGLRITIDVEKNGEVHIDRIPRPMLDGLIQHLKHRIAKFKRQFASGQHRPWFRALPWTYITIKDRNGGWQTLKANVDTGSNTDLSLPPAWIEKLGLRLPDKDEVETWGGLMDVRQGKVDVRWLGCQQPANCVERRDMDRPIVGMNLFRGKRIIIDLDYEMPPVEITDIPEPLRNT